MLIYHRVPNWCVVNVFQSMPASKVQRLDTSSLFMKHNHETSLSHILPHETHWSHISRGFAVLLHVRNALPHGFSAESHRRSAPLHWAREAPLVPHWRFPARNRTRRWPSKVAHHGVMGMRQDWAAFMAWHNYDTFTSILGFTLW